MNEINEIINAFEKFNDELYVIAIYKIGPGYIVIAKHTPDKETPEMDPYYSYFKEKITPISIADDPKAYLKILVPENCIYEID